MRLRKAELADLLQRHRWVPLAAAFAVIEVAYVFFVSAGRFTPTTNFLVPTSTYDPRILQLAGKITF